ncbi:coiled-coil domain-containing protein 9 isoform X2 [Latimeria chalumnae]
MSSAVDLKTKEEKDAELDKRIEALRKKNEALVRRYQEIEEDRKKAEQEGIAVTTPRKPRHAELEPDKKRNEKENFTITVDLSSTAVEKRVINERRPASAPRSPHGTPGQRQGRSPPQRITGRVGPNAPSRPSRGGQGDRQMWDSPREDNANRSERGGRGRRGRGGGGGGAGVGNIGGAGPDRKSKEWEERRRQNIEKMNEEMEKIAEYERSQGDGFKNPIRNFLDDPRRSGPLPEGDRKDGTRRHIRNWGGPDFEKVKTGMEREKEWHGRRQVPKNSVDMTMSMTGRERAEYMRWKKEREQIDQERLARHRNATGQWRREWDAEKNESMFKEESVQKTQPEQGSRQGKGRFKNSNKNLRIPDDLRRPPKPSTFGDFISEDQAKDFGRKRGRGRGRERGKSYSMHDNRWEEKQEEAAPEKEEETLKKEEKESEENPQDPEPHEEEEEEEDDDEWEDTSEGEEVVIGEEESGDHKLSEEDPEPQLSKTKPEPSPKEKRTRKAEAVPKLSIPAPNLEKGSKETEAKPPSPFSPADGYRPVSDWGEEMELLSPRSSVEENPLKPESTREDSRSSTEDGRVEKGEDNATREDSHNSAEDGRVEKGEDNATREGSHSSTEDGRVEKGEDNATREDSHNSAEDGRVGKGEDNATREGSHSSAEDSRVEKGEDNATREDSHSSAEDGHVDKVEDNAVQNRADAVTETGETQTFTRSGEPPAESAPCDQQHPQSKESVDEPAAAKTLSSVTRSDQGVESQELPSCETAEGENCDSYLPAQTEQSTEAAVELENASG